MIMNVNQMYVVFLLVLIGIFVTLTVKGAIRGRKEFRTEQMRCKRYVHMILNIWIATLVVFAMMFIGNITLANIGFRGVNFNHNRWFTVITLVLSGLLLLQSVTQLISSKEAKEKMIQALSEDPEVMDLLPRTKREKCLWFWVSFTAGTTEEILYRGFLVFLLQTIFVGISPLLIILTASLAFGIAHFYQGVKGIIKTGIVGAVLMSLFLVTDSLLLPMILHFIVDFSTIAILSPEGSKI